MNLKRLESKLHNNINKDKSSEESNTTNPKTQSFKKPINNLESLANEVNEDQLDISNNNDESVTNSEYSVRKFNEINNNNNSNKINNNTNYGSNNSNFNRNPTNNPTSNKQSNNEIGDREPIHQIPDYKSFIIKIPSYLLDGNDADFSLLQKLQLNIRNKEIKTKYEEQVYKLQQNI